MVDIPTDPQLGTVRRARAVRRRGQLSACAAAEYLGEYELRRVGTRGDWGIYLRGSSVRVGTVFKNTSQFTRALMNTLDHLARKRAPNGAPKRPRKYPHPSGDGVQQGMTESTPRVP